MGMEKLRRPKIRDHPREVKVTTTAHAKHYIAGKRKSGDRYA